jgi:hypothetical protein
MRVKKPQSGLQGLVTPSSLGSDHPTWGRHRPRPGRRSSGSHTTTCVGRTSSGLRANAQDGDHPHLRGEDVRTRRGGLHPYGSPPRAWGGPALPDAAVGRRRITPTCVGRTRPTYAATWRTLGSPPRAWGGRRDRPVRPTGGRITPTRVGRTGPVAPRTSPCSDHPHVRGEDSASARSAASVSGSPPRAWGGRRPADRARAGNRITPTCVGRTPRCSPSPCTTTDHPHVRGEDAYNAYMCRQRRDHPHVRGEDMRDARISTSVSGSPPRAWGGHDRRAVGREQHRITPVNVWSQEIFEGSLSGDS